MLQPQAIALGERISKSAQVGGGVDYDSSEIVTLITAAPLCDDCIARKTKLPSRRVRTVLNGIARERVVITSAGQCGGCLKEAVVHRLNG